MLFQRRRERALGGTRRQLETITATAKNRMWARGGLRGAAAGGQEGARRAAKALREQIKRESSFQPALLLAESAREGSGSAGAGRAAALRGDAVVRGVGAPRKGLCSVRGEVFPLTTGR